MNRFYRNRPNWIDGTEEFHSHLRRYLQKDQVVLELGPGPLNQTSDCLAGVCKSVHGLDVDQEARQNKNLERVYIYNGKEWPIPDGEYDAVVADWVLEHLANPQLTIAESFRVLRPGGLFLFRTPNLWNYMPRIASMTPHWFHRLVANRLRSLPQESHDPYPTYYRMNTFRKIRKIFCAAGFEAVDLLSIEKDPSYGMCSRVLFLLFMAHERIVNSTESLKYFRMVLLGSFRKPHGIRCPPGLTATAE